MKKTLAYTLSKSTVIEPLVNRWHAWSYLISPVPAALHLRRFQLPILNSFLEDPETHAQMSRDPQFASGSFCNLSPDFAPQVSELLKKTEREQKDRIELADIIIRFQNFLHNEAKGLSLEPYYSKMPDELRGLSELVYDYYHHPTVRFIEGLLYESRYYDQNLQSFRIFRLSRDDERPFILSTPRFVGTGEIDWKITFADPGLDELLKSDLTPQPLGSYLDILGLSQRDEPLLLPFLTEVCPKLPERWMEKRVRIRYFGHACVLLEWDGISILTDPHLSAVPEGGGVDRFSFHDLPENLDFVLITHDHHDHFSLETLLRLRTRIGCLVVPKSMGLMYGDVSLKLMAKKLMFKQVIDLDALESIPLPDGEIIGIPFLGEQSDLAHAKIAYVVRVGTEQILFAADSDCLEKRIYENVRKTIGRVETVFIGTECVGAPLTWRNGVLFPNKPSHEQDQTRRYHGCDSQRALNLMEALGAKRLYAYAMGKEPWLEHLLGLGLSDDSPQMRESSTLMQKGLARGFTSSERPFGKSEIYLDRSSSPMASAASINSIGPHDLGLCLSYWKRQLKDTRRMMSYSSEKRMPPVHSSGLVGECSLKLAPKSYDALVDFSAKCGHSVATILLASLQTVLHRYAGNDDIIISVVPDSFASDACLSIDHSAQKALFLRTDLSGNPDFLSLLDRTGAVIEAAIVHSKVSTEVLLETLPSGDSHLPRALCQVMFAYNCDLRGRFGDSTSDLSCWCDLALLTDDKIGNLTTTIRYNTGVLKLDGVNALLERYLARLERLISHPGLTLAQHVEIFNLRDLYLDDEDQFIF